MEVPGGCSSPAKRPRKASAPGLGRRRRRPNSRLGARGERERDSREGGKRAEGEADGGKKKRTGICVFFLIFFSPI
jgi:hypothetical protein